MLQVVSRPRHPGLALLLLVAACGAQHPGTPPPSTPPAGYEDTWRPFSTGGVLRPKDVGSGKVDVIFHFHAGKAAEQEYRSANLRAIVVSYQVDGLGTKPYWDSMNDPNRFEQMKAELKVPIGRIAIVAWSAGYAAVQRVLVQQRHYEEIDALILLDALHTGYAPPPPKKANLVTIAPFVRFAHDAAAGKKLFVFTHSSIVPEGYASTREVADTLADDLGVKWTTEPRPGPPGAFRSADIGDAHLRGWEGMTARDHVIHDHFIDEVIATWLAPRWK